MFETKIQFKGREYTIRFGSWVTGEIEKILKSNPGNIEVFAYMIFFALIQGEGLRAKYIAKDDIGFDVFDCYDWIDEQGGLSSDKVQQIQNLYVEHTNMNVPKNPKATTSTTSKAKMTEAQQKALLKALQS